MVGTGRAISLPARVAVAMRMPAEVVAIPVVSDDPGEGGAAPAVPSADALPHADLRTCCHGARVAAVMGARTVPRMTDDERPGSGDPAGSGSPVAGSALLLSESFTAATVTGLRHRLAAAVAAAGLSGALGEDFVLAAHELVINAVQHGGGAGSLELRLLADVLTCEVVDHGQGADGLRVRLPQTDQPGGRG